MTPKILIAYASATGSTAEIAAEMGKIFSAAGWAADVRPVGEVSGLAGYQAVLIGSAVQYGRWLPEAVSFVKTHQAALSNLPVALFCVHIRNLEENPASRAARRAYLNEVRALLPAAREVYFAGRFDRDGAALLLPRWAARLIPAVDRRDWMEIRAWAEQAPGMLLQVGGRSGVVN